MEYLEYNILLFIMMHEVKVISILLLQIKNILSENIVLHQLMNFEFIHLTYLTHLKYESKHNWFGV